MESEKIIKKIKELRKERGYTLEQMTHLTGFSKGYLSKIENASNLPLMTTLHRIAIALGVDITYFFSDSKSRSPDCHLSIVRKNEREKMIVGSQGTPLTIFPMALQKTGRNMEPAIIELPFENHQVYQHEGEDLYFLLEGEARFFYDGKEYTFSAGDCVYFDGNIPHTGHSIGDKPAKALVVYYSYKKTTIMPF